MRITNISPHDIYIPDHGFCLSGDSIEVPLDAAVQLVKSGRFTKTPVKRPPRPRQSRQAN